MSYIIIVDMRESNGQIIAIHNDEMNLAQYDTEEEAAECIKNHPLGVFPYEMLDMGE